MNETRNYIINKLIQNGFLFTGNAEESHYYFSDGRILVNYVTPHSGTDNQHMIRAEMKEDFDRWGNAQYEQLFDNRHSILSIIAELENLTSVEDEDE